MRAIAACFIIGSICFGASNAAAEGVVIPLSAEFKKALDVLRVLGGLREYAP